MFSPISIKDDFWLDSVSETVENLGFAVVKNVLSKEFTEKLKKSLHVTEEKIIKEVGEHKLHRANEKGVLRLICKFSPIFLKILEIPEILAVVDRLLSPTAIMHLQNGFILPPELKETIYKEVFQQKFHMDFPRVLHQYLFSINIFLPLINFTNNNGATLVVPGSHQRKNPPSKQYMSKYAIPVLAEEGDMVIFDSTLWHCSGRNQTQENRCAINHQFTHSYLKQQIDYVRALGDETILKLPTRTQQLLGYFSRVVTSLDDYYQPPEKRLYLSNQG